MRMRKTPRGMRVHIAILGRRNVGKSSLLNALTRQRVAIVSRVAGTTTDPVEKPMELLPLGPVLFIDTAGIDDTGILGELRVQKTRRVLDRADIGILVARPDQWGTFEEELLEELRNRGVPFIVVLNHSDRVEPSPELLEGLRRRGITVVRTAAVKGEGILDVREALLRAVPEEFLHSPAIVGDLVPAGELVVLVVPIDKEAPRGRLILPQVQTIRDILDHDAYCLVVKEHELADALGRLNRPPALVVTDSQAFARVAADTPAEIPLTSFSILFARLKGDLNEFVRGAAALDRLKPGDPVLVAEACTHHPIEDDIGRVKIPAWLAEYVGGALEFSHVQGHDFPAELTPYKLVIHCGACMFNRRELLSRTLRCRGTAVPVTNYGLVIAKSLGILDRALQPFSITP